MITPILKRVKAAETFVRKVWNFNNDFALRQDWAAIELVVRLCTGVVIVQPPVAGKADLARVWLVTAG